ncbi:rhodanese-like domain-containing protein [Arenimonas sp.]|uniref:rhodanese-like domain-containing protein n=1 Tax=Arenimonas sp. TaxID=1872635 RepID=UPI0035AE9DD9
MRRFIPLSLLLLAALPAVALAGRPAVAPAAVAEITARADAPILLDVRTPEEFAQGHLPGAVLIPHDQLAERLDEINRDRWVLVYCRSGKRATTAQEILEEAGIEVRQVEGSWLRWQEEDRPVRVPDGAEGGE